MRSKEELNAIKGEAEALGAKLCELSEDELEQVTGGDKNKVMLSIIATIVQLNTLPGIAGGNNSSL